MSKKYMIWWHNYVDDIDHELLSIKEISKSVENTLNKLNDLKKLEEKGKIRIKKSISINPLYIEILDSSIEKEIANNPLVDTD